MVCGSSCLSDPCPCRSKKVAADVARLEFAELENNTDTVTVGGVTMVWVVMAKSRIRQSETYEDGALEEGSKQIKDMTPALKADMVKFFQKNANEHSSFLRQASTRVEEGPQVLGVDDGSLKKKVKNIINSHLQIRTACIQTETKTLFQNPLFENHLTKKCLIILRHQMKL